MLFLVMLSQYRASQLEKLRKKEMIPIILNLQAISIRQEERIHKLEGQLHKDSHNSSLPPSQFPPPAIKNLRPKTTKSRGGQPGHPGHTLKMVDHPDHLVHHTVKACSSCGKNLSRIPAMGYEKRQVFDIPPLICEITEHRAEKKRCSCGRITTALFPEAIQAPVQYGLHLQTLVSLLANHEYVSYNRISELMEYLIGYRMNEATVCSLQDKLYQKLAVFEARSKLHLTQSAVMHNDETGLSIEGKSRWLHVSSNSQLTHYAVGPQRGKVAIDRIGILPHFKGVTVHDGLCSYFQYKDCRHALCNVHHLRELTFFAEEEQAEWATFFKELLLFAKTSVEQAKEKGQDHLDSSTLQEIRTRYEEILGGASLNQHAPIGKSGKCKRTDQQNLLERLWKQQEYVLAFTTDFRIPFDNNLAERDLRMMKLKDKVSGTFRSFHGAECFARIRGYISTVRKHQRNVFTEIEQALSGQPFFLPGW